jgi:hypothetical protein
MIHKSPISSLSAKGILNKNNKFNGDLNEELIKSYGSNY